MSNRYTSLTDQAAVDLAHADLLAAPDHKGHRPLLEMRTGESFEDYRNRVIEFDKNYVCKMDATDFLRLIAKRAPELITETIIQDCQRVFSKCNDATCINIIDIFRHLRRKDTLPFLEQVRDDCTRANVSRPIRKGDRFVMQSHRDNSCPDFVSEEAAAAIDSIRNNVA